jgi:nitrogen fixation NifU-like protein
MEYSAIVIEHFRNPRNVGEIEDPSGVGKMTSPVCGDMMELYLKVDPNGVITDAKFRTFGCGAAIASSSVLTELIKGKTIEEAGKITKKTILEALGGLPEPKIHCSLLAEDALKLAIEDYYKRRGKER